ncbi:MAG TPA: hypothetical protein VF507_00535 [Pyrinomonadaceae bacterium]|jgi:hypothetical protein
MSYETEYDLGHGIAIGLNRLRGEAKGMPTSEVSLEIAELTEDVQRLNEILSKLEARIESTLSPPVPQAQADETEARREPHTKLGAELGQIHNDIRRALARAHDMLKRCEL